MVSIRTDQIAAAIARAVQDYTEDVTAGIEKTVGEVAELVRTDTEAMSPKRTGRYARGWKVSKQDKPGVARRIIWNKKHYRLVHLLEKGHAVRGGGRVPGRPHLRPAFERHVNQLQDDIRRVIRNGG